MKFTDKDKNNKKYQLFNMRSAAFRFLSTIVCPEVDCLVSLSLLLLLLLLAVIVDVDGWFEVEVELLPG